MFSDGSLRPKGSWDLIKSLSKEKESESPAENSEFSSKAVDNATQQSLTGATYAMIKQLRLSTKQQQCLARSETYRRKYQPLPPLSPVPSLLNITKGK